MFWSPFRNEDSGKSDKAEKGTKVMRRLSSLRSRVTGSWQKDKVREREVEFVEGIVKFFK